MRAINCGFAGRQLLHITSTDCIQPGHLYLGVSSCCCWLATRPQHSHLGHVNVLCSGTLCFEGSSIQNLLPHTSAWPMPVSLTIAVLVVQVLDEDDAVQQVTTPKQRNEFLAALTAAEDWLYDQGEDEQASVFR